MTAAIYIRLSLEDDDLIDGKSESESITNQRGLLMDYIRASPELCQSMVLEFSDDGYSGKNFDRPGVQKLLTAARSGKIDCILVKDLSRFGRDYITVGNYITKVFPFLGVRFIAVNDHFDSTRKGDLDSLDTSFQALIYDLYSRDLSQKVRTAKARLASQGVYINPVAPYGYRKSPDDRHLLVPDPNTAGTVRRIFQMAADGITVEKIAWTLNSEGIPPPSKVKKGTSSEHANWSNEYWSKNNVYYILRDRQYIGSNVFGKRTRRQIGVRRTLTARLEDWIVVDDCHEPLVSKNLFQKVQEQLGGEYKQICQRRIDNPLSRKVYCGVCHYAIVRRGAKNKYYRCGRPRTVPGLTCCQVKIFEKDLMTMVVEAIRVQARYGIELKHIADHFRAEQESTASSLQQEIRQIHEQLAQAAEQAQKLYEEFIAGTISRDTYAERKAGILDQRDALRRSEAETKSKLLEISTPSPDFVAKYQGYAELDKLTTEIAADLLDRITIWQDGRVEISLNYLDGIASTLGQVHGASAQNEI